MHLAISITNFTAASSNVGKFSTNATARVVIICAAASIISGKFSNMMLTIELSVFVIISTIAGRF